MLCSPAPVVDYTLDACFLTLRRKFKPGFVSCSSISRGTTTQTCRYCFTSVISLITHSLFYPPVSIISAVYRPWSTELRHSRAQRQVGATALCKSPSLVSTLYHRLPSSTCLSRLSQLLSRICYIQKPNIVLLVRVCISVSFSYACDLVVEPLVIDLPHPLLLRLLSRTNTPTNPLVVRSAQPERPSILCLTLFRRRLASRLWLFTLVSVSQFLFLLFLPLSFSVGATLTLVVGLSSYPLCLRLGD